MLQRGVLSHRKFSHLQQHYRHVTSPGLAWACRLRGMLLTSAWWPGKRCHGQQHHKQGIGDVGEQEGWEPSILKVLQHSNGGIGAMV